jgi:hypothetical protein
MQGQEAAIVEMGLQPQMHYTQLRDYAAEVVQKLV